jgi:hypothetical protein
MNACQKYFSACLLALLTQAAFAQSAPPPGAAAGFAVLGNAAVSCTDGNITGQVGTNQATSDVPPGAVTLVRCPASGVHVGDQAAKDAYAAFLARYAALSPEAGDACTTLTGTLSGMTLAPGTYCFPAAAALTGVLTLDGPPTAIWTFKIGSTIATPPALPTGALTGTNFSVVMAGGGQACNVTWWVAEAATLTDSNLKGTLLAGAATTLTRGTLLGSDFAQAGATITGTAAIGCAAVSGPGPGPAPGPRSCSDDRVSGGGYVEAEYGRATFGVTAGIRNGAFRGHLTYIDHGEGLKVKGTGVTAYVALDAKTRHIEGTATIDGVAGAYTVDVTDNGEPGRNHDLFKISLSNGYSASGTLSGGNIQLHKQHCDKNGHDGDRDDEDDDGDHGDNDRDHGQGAKPFGFDDQERK